jgi:uncharacterized protein (TIGR02001 family)
MKKSLLALAVLAALTPLHSNAQTAAAPAAEPASPLSGNLAIVSDYRFRGISQSYRLPAVQGGIDYAHESGFYLGNWNSSVSGNQFPNGASLEMDFYGGFKIPLSDAITLDLGGLYYYYPGAYYNAGPRGGKPTMNNFELYVGSTFGPLTAKVSFTATDYFGVNGTTGYANNGSSKGSYYLDLGYSTEIAAKTSLVAHVGYQNVKSYSNYNYVDYKLGVTYDYTGWILGAAWIGTNAKKDYWTYSEGSGDSKFVGNNTVVLSISKAF